jgi:integrase
MARPRGIPSYRRHKSSGQAVVTLTDPSGNRRDVLLGAYGSTASRQEYARVLAEWEARGRRLPEREGDADLTVLELILRYWEHAEKYYRHTDGTPTGEISALQYSLRPLKFLHGDTPARDFGPSALKAVRELLVKGYDHPKYGRQNPICRNQINARVKRIRRLFKWAVENELLPASVHHGLCAVPPLKRGRTEAKESERVIPVARAIVESTLPILPPLVADMVALQMESGMRSGEMVIMRGIDLDTTGKVWLYRPLTHKTAHHGHERIVPIGPKGQAILRRHLKPDVQAFLFSPADSIAAFRAEQRKNRKSKVQPSQQCRSKKNPRKRPGERYSSRSYALTIRQAIERHNRKATDAERIPHWHPHQLRHLRALELKREAGLDVARAVLGHRSPILTEHYATLDVGKAAAVMEKIG